MSESEIVTYRVILAFDTWNYINTFCMFIIVLAVVYWVAIKTSEGER